MVASKATTVIKSIRNLKVVKFFKSIEIVEIVKIVRIFRFNYVIRMPINLCTPPMAQPTSNTETIVRHDDSLLGLIEMCPHTHDDNTITVVAVNELTLFSSILVQNVGNHSH